jgi:hypothetical protein
MNTLRQTCVATILSLTLAVPVLAGHMDTTGAPAPAPPPTTNSTTQTTSTATSVLLMVLGLIYR